MRGNGPPQPFWTYSGGEGGPVRRPIRLDQVEGTRVNTHGADHNGKYGSNTSCGTVVLQRSLDQTGGPRRQRSTRVGLFSASGSCWHEPLLQLRNVSVANPFSFEVRTWFKASPCRSVPFLGSRAVVPLSESFQISFAIPNPPSRGLHSWRFMPPVCTGAVLVAGSHTLAGE